MRTLALALLLAAAPAAHAKVEIRGNQLRIHGETQPQLFGAELQYFRLRGGYGRNVPREKVIALWNQALSRMAEAKMNTVSFYIPWDFHEYAEGKFDFTGTADEDGDGNADYPSRDIITFFRLIEEHGFKRIMVRPGPYINAEWGFMGFGAIPLWFHEKYPESHMQAPNGLRRALYDYLDPALLRHTHLWFKALYEQVLKSRIGPGKPIAFVQLDNETNFQWQGVYSTDYAPRSVARYQAFVKERYRSDLTRLNLAHDRQWKAWDEIQPPTERGKNLGEDQDWYRYNDFLIFQFLARVRATWERIGLREPEVLFTLAESYNAPQDGLLPHYLYRNYPGKTGMTTVNLYPKTWETPDRALLNSPFKTDLDVKSADSATDYYLRSPQEWVLGPEIQGGWWRGINVTPESRRQTYLSSLGHGMKALFIYYWHEGDNWGVDWAKKAVTPHYEQLLRDRGLVGTPRRAIPGSFWSELQTIVNREIYLGINARHAIESDTREAEKLFFDAPLDGNVNPRNHYFDVKLLGERLIQPFERFLGRALEANDSLAILKDSSANVPSPAGGLNSALAASEWTGGLLGWLLNSGANPSVVHGELARPEELKDVRVFTHVDTGTNHPRTILAMREALAAGRTVVNFLGTDSACRVGIPGLPCGKAQGSLAAAALGRDEPVDFALGADGGLASPGGEGTRGLRFLSGSLGFTYDLGSAPGCATLLSAGGKTVGFECRVKRGRFVQIGVPVFEPYAGSGYGKIADEEPRRLFLDALLKRHGLRTALSLEGSRSVAAFARKDPWKELVWVTLKTGLREPQSFRLRLDSRFLAANLKGRGATLSIEEPLSQKTTTMPYKEALTNGLTVELGPDDSKVLVLRRK